MLSFSTTQTVKLAAVCLVLWLLKRYFGGARNTAERNMHSRVVLMTVTILSTAPHLIIQADCDYRAALQALEL